MRQRLDIECARMFPGGEHPLSCFESHNIASGFFDDADVRVAQARWRVGLAALLDPGDLGPDADQSALGPDSYFVRPGRSELCFDQFDFAAIEVKGLLVHWR